MAHELNRMSVQEVETAGIEGAQSETIYTVKLYFSCNINTHNICSHTHCVGILQDNVRWVILNDNDIVPGSLPGT